MQKGIIKPEDLPYDEKVYLKKGYKGWTVVHPIKNEDGSINWKNLLCGGSWWNWIITAIIVIVTLGVLYEYSSNLEFCKSLLDQQVVVKGSDLTNILLG